MGEKKTTPNTLSEILRVLSSDINLKIVSLLKSKELNPREIARIIGRDETDISRRLSKMSKLGIVKSRWARVGNKNVKLFRLNIDKLTIAFDIDGVKLVTEKPIEGLNELSRIKYSLDRVSIPSVKEFVGRVSELNSLKNANERIIVVTGISGVGKTSLVAKFVNDYVDEPKYWYTINDLDYAEIFAWKLALFLDSLGYSDAIEYISSNSRDLAGIARFLAMGLNSKGVILIIDDYHKCRDKRLRTLLASIASSIENCKLIIISRVKPVEIVAGKPTLEIKLEGLRFEEAYEYAKSKGLNIDHRAFTEIYIATQGHPLLLNIVARIARSEGIDKALSMVLKGNIQASIRRSVLSSLTPQEREVFKALSCFDEPLPLDLI